MRVKANLKEARARMQAGEPSQALSMIQTVLDSGSPELQDDQTMYAVLVTAGLAGLAVEDYDASEASFRKAAKVMPNAPQAWKGLIDCLERMKKMEALPEALLRAAEIAESKQNYARARSVRARLAQVLEGLGRVEEALEALVKHLDGSAAIAADEPVDNLPLLLHAAVLEEAIEGEAVRKRTEKRLAKDNTIGDAAVTSTGKSRSRAAVTFDYRMKAIRKDDEEAGPVSTRLKMGLEALEIIACSANSDIALPRPAPVVLAHFCRVFLRRAVQRAESTGCDAGRWGETLTACSSLRNVLVSFEPGADDGWLATTSLLLSTFHSNDGVHSSEIAVWAAGDDRYPWLTAEACMHLAWESLASDDASKADGFLKRAQSARDCAGSNHGWVCLSGPGSSWRELSLRCLIDDRLGYAGAGGDARFALGRVEAAIEALDEFCRSGCPPLPERDPSGSLNLARAPLMLRLGKIEDARSVLEAVSCNSPCSSSPRASSACGDGADHDASAEASMPSVGRPPCLHCRALCVSADADLLAGQSQDARAKLEAVLEADDGFPDALSKLGWIILGFSGVDGGSESSIARRRMPVAGGSDGPEAARPLLERACQEEPRSSRYAFKLARCYWELGGEYLTNRRFCFSLLLKAAKLDPTNAQAFEWLGHWYQRVGGDRERARGCFMRAVKFNPTMRGAGEALALLYLESGQETLAMALFKECAVVSVACDWAWADLGRLKILEGKISEAAAHLQQAIRGRPTSWSHWSDLGWCYHAEGKQAAALKAYGRAEELLDQQALKPGDAGGNPVASSNDVQLAARVRVKAQLGTIRRQIGQVNEAAESFEQALVLDPDSGLALEGAGEAYLAQAHARMTEGLCTAAAESLRKGCDVVRRLLRRQSGREYGEECSWKLLGDLHTYAHKLPAVCFQIREFSKDGTTRTDEELLLQHDTAASTAAQQASTREGSANRLAFVQEGEAAYARVVAILRAKRAKALSDVVGDSQRESEPLAATGDSHEVPSDSLASALYDLGLNYLLRARLVCADAGEGSGLWEQDVYDHLPEVSDLSRLAETTFKQALDEDPLHSESWNGLGVVSRDPLVRQHCWVRSVQLAHNHSAWANLGMLYLRWGLDNQAYESLGGLQAVMDHPNMWVGLGLLKESEACRSDITASKRRRLLSQASDAYYSSLETGQHVEGLLGLGTAAGITHSQSDALVVLEQYLDLCPNNAQAWNRLGAAAEFAGRIPQAIASYRCALSLLQEQAARFEGVPCTQAKARRVDAFHIATSNLSRALTLQGQAKEAVELADGLGPEKCLLNLGRAYALQGEWATALDVLQQDIVERVEGLISAAVTRYRSGDWTGATNACTSLMKQYPKNRRVVLTAISVGALTGNAAMSQSSLHMLQTLPVCPKAFDPDGRAMRAAIEEELWASHLALRAAGEPDSVSRRALCKAVHLSPSSVRSWIRLGTVVADAAVSRHSTLPFTSPSSTRECAEHKVPAELAHACLTVGKEQAKLKILNKNRDTHKGGSIAHGGSGADDTAMGVDITAADYAKGLCGLAKANLCGGKPGSSSQAAKTAARAVHMYPGAGSTWRCLAAALVAQALSSSGGQDALGYLGPALGIYNSIAAADSGLEDEQQDQKALAAIEADYIKMLLADGVAPQTATLEEVDHSDESAARDSPHRSFASKLMSARSSLRATYPSAVEQYKDVVRSDPRSLIAWRELAACYQLFGSDHASFTALKSGSRVPRALVQGDLASAAPLHLQMGANALVTGREKEALSIVDGAFRCGKGGAAGHVLRGVINAQMGKDGLAGEELKKAREADPAISGVVDRLSPVTIVSKSR